MKTTTSKSKRPGPNRRVLEQLDAALARNTARLRETSDVVTTMADKPARRALEKLHAEGHPSRPEPQGGSQSAFEFTSKPSNN